VLRAYFKTSEIITSLMLNYVAAYLLTYLIFNSESYWRETEGFNAKVFPTGKPLPDNALWLAATLHLQGSIALPLGAGLAALCAVGLWLLYSRTRFGFEVQVLGDSPRAAHYAGMRTRRKIVAVMAISGALAGLGGASRSETSGIRSTPIPTAASGSTTGTPESSSLRSRATTRSPCSSWPS
jgi:simple sugar transport system permease protein